MQTEPYEIAIETAISMLEEAQSLLTEQITSYPGPISGCDAQFNQLLSDRKRVSRALQALSDQPFIPTPRLSEPNALPEMR